MKLSDEAANERRHVYLNELGVVWLESKFNNGIRDDEDIARELENDGTRDCMLLRYARKHQRPIRITGENDCWLPQKYAKLNRPIKPGMRPTASNAEGVPSAKVVVQRRITGRRTAVGGVKSLRIFDGRRLEGDMLTSDRTNAWTVS